MTTRKSSSRRNSVYRKNLAGELSLIIEQGVEAKHYQKRRSLGELRARRILIMSKKYS